VPSQVVNANPSDSQV